MSLVTKNRWNSDENGWPLRLVSHSAEFFFTESENPIENLNSLLFCYRHFHIFASDFYLFCISMLLNKFWCLASLAFYFHGLSTICWNKKNVVDVVNGMVATGTER